MRVIRAVLYGILFLLGTISLSATTRFVPTCSSTDAQNTINASADGDLLIFPSCGLTSGSNVTIPATKGLTIQGQGNCSNCGTETAVYTDATTIGWNLIVTLGTTTQVTTISGITWTSDQTPKFLAASSAQTSEFRLTNGHWTAGGPWTSCRCYGVIDHNLADATNPFSWVRVFESAYDQRTGTNFADGGGASWQRANSMGTRNAVFVETNTVSYVNGTAGASSVTDGRSGGRAVVRYNFIKNQAINTHDAEITNERGMRQVENYNNTYKYTNSVQGSIYNQRGGTGVFHGNCFKLANGSSFTQAGTPFVITLQRARSPSAGIGNPWLTTCQTTTSSDKVCIGSVPKTCSADADCTGDFSGKCVREDGTGSDNYKCRDQVGAGLEDVITGVQALEPYYFWSNTQCSTGGADCSCSTPSTTVAITNGTSNQLQSGRDYYPNTAMPGYTPFTYPHPLVSGMMGSPGTMLTGRVSLSGAVSINGAGTQIVLQSISISPSDPVIPFTQSQTFTALGTFSTGGGSADVTSQATWTSSNNTIASPQGSPPGNSTYQCNARGTVTVTATIGAIAGTTTLNCQSPTFTPVGTITTTQSGISLTVVQFVGANGTSPFTFSSVDLPGFLSLSNTGCAGSQINCSLVGTPSTVGVFNFHVQATDNLGNQACTSPGCAISLNVVAAGAEDNIYCNSSNVIVGLAQDGPAAPLAHCFNTAIANTPTTAGSIIFVCPSGQVGVAQCALTTIGANPNADVCYTTGGVWCPSVQAALTYAWNGGGTPRCWDIQIYPTIDNTPSGTPNIYTAPLILAPGDLNCGPAFSRNYLWIRTTQFANLPPPGNRVTPSWLNQSSITGRPNYSQTSQFGITAGRYLAELRAEATAGGVCSVIDSAQGFLLHGTRFMGLWFTCPHSRDTGVDQWGNHVCPSDLNGSWNCSPGAYGEGLVNMGCDVINNVSCIASGGGYNIFDRVILSGCDDISMATCFDTMSNLYVGSGGDYQAIIDSSFYHAFCFYAIGPCVESHAITGGNLPAAKDDAVLKVVNNYIEASGVEWFTGGGGSVSGFFPTDREIRDNHGFKPLTWKPDHPSFPGKVQDGWINAQNGDNQGAATRVGTAVSWVSGNKFNVGMQGNAIAINGVSYTVLTYNSGTSLTLSSAPGTTDTNTPYVFPASKAYGVGTTCSIDPPKAGTTALCTVTIDHGLLKDVTITNKGSGYGVYDKSNGNTFGAYPGFYLTDSGVTFASCQKEPSGEVNAAGTAVTWVHGNKFITGMTGTYIFIAPAPGTSSPPGTCDAVTPNCYLIDAVTNNTNLTIHTSAGTLTDVDYQAYLPSRGDCIKPMTGMPNVKNHMETKHVVRALIEGNVWENCWTGVSDQDGFCAVLSPKNANNNCPTCKTVDITYRYNLCRKSNKGMQIAASPATQGETLSLGIQRVSIHDDIFDGLNGVYWTAGTSPIQSNSNSVFAISNGNTDGLQISDIKINHITAVQTLPTGYSLNQGGFLNLNYNCQYVKNSTLPALMYGMTAENSIAAGGARNSAVKNNGCIQCINQACTDHVPAHGPTEVSMRQLYANEFDLPSSGGNYTGGQLMGFQIISGGACTVAPTTATLTGGGGSGATASLTTSGASPNIIVKTIFPVKPGQGYTSTPTLVLNGTCPTPPSINVYIAGAGLPLARSSCYDHNGAITAAWNGLIPMSPYPTQQIDPNNNQCDDTNGGGNLSVTNWTGSDSPKFISLPVDGAGAECNGDNCATGDLHLQGGSVFAGKANDGRDMGADVDKVLGTVTGTPSQYTKCFITASSFQCP